MYSIEDELENCYADYLEQGKVFSHRHIQQRYMYGLHTENAVVMDIQIDRTVNEENTSVTSHCVAIDRITGEKIPLESLYNVPEDQIIDTVIGILQASDPDCPESVYQEMREKCQLEWIRLENDNQFTITFPIATLTEKEYKGNYGVTSYGIDQYLAEQIK